MAVFNPFDFFLEPEAEKFPFAYDPALDHELAPFQRKCWLTPQFMKYLTAVRRDLLGEIKRRTKKERLEIPEKKNRARMIFSSPSTSGLWKDIKYLIRLEPGVQTPEETLEKGSGSCRDSAWLLCQLFRHCGLAARFVSGYLIQLKAGRESRSTARAARKRISPICTRGAKFICPARAGSGWTRLPGCWRAKAIFRWPARPIPPAPRRSPARWTNAKCEFSFEMSVTRIYESPRVTKPYTEEQWEQIESLGHAIDADLKKGDVRLTMGGEPTFVSIDDPDGAEWNFTAVSHKKRILSGELIKRLREKFAPGSLLHYGQGKWYPGEPLPRWALAAYWRKDGVPIWKDDSLIADESKNYGHGAKEAKELLSRIAPHRRRRSEAFDSRPTRTHFITRGRSAVCPSNVTPEKSNLKDKQERERIARIFQQGLGTVVGYALPLKRVGTATGWMSGAWFLRDDDTLWLIPGDSPMGLRLPLDSHSVGRRKGLSVVCDSKTRRNPKLPELPKEFPYRPAISSVARTRRHLPGEGRGQRAQKLGEKPKPLEPLPPDEDPLRRPGAAAKARRGSSAPRYASSRATDGCMSSCRRSRRRRIIWI